jgi:hypothetical protein
MENFKYLKMHNLLSSTKKLNCKSFSLSAFECKTGSKLAKVEGSTCSKCYALKGNYRYKNYKNLAKDRLVFSGNLDELKDALKLAIKMEHKDIFRFFDSGDLQSLAMFTMFCELASELPNIRFWLPTREYSIIRKAIRENVHIPKNLIVRVSSPMINQKPLKEFQNLGLVTSTTHKETSLSETVKYFPSMTADSLQCPASKQDGKCLDCDACYDSKVKNISYLVH